VRRPSQNTANEALTCARLLPALPHATTSRRLAPSRVCLFPARNWPRRARAQRVRVRLRRCGCTAYLGRVPSTLCAPRTFGERGLAAARRGEAAWASPTPPPRRLLRKGEACTLAPDRREDTFSREAPLCRTKKNLPHFSAQSLFQWQKRQAGLRNETGWRWQRDRLTAFSFAPRLPDCRISRTAVATTHATAIVCT